MRTADEVRRYDNFKLAVLLVLILLLLCMIFNQCRGQSIIAPTVNLPNDGKALTGEDIDLTGTGQADSELQIVMNNKVVGNANVGNDGNWAHTTQVDEPGDYEVTVQSVNESDEVQASSEPVSLLVEQAPLPVVDTPTINLPSGPFFANQAITLDGTASPDYGLQVLLNGEVDGNATVDSNGQWSYETQIGDADEYEVSVQSVDDDGTVLASSEEAFLAIASSTVTVDVPNDGQVAAGEAMTLSGTAPPGAEVEILLDGEVIGTTTAGDDGTWSFATQIDESGDQEITVRALDGSGSAMAGVDPATASLSVGDVAADAEADAEALTVSLPDGDVAPGEEITLSGTGTPGSEVEILVDGDVVGTTTVGDDGTWSLTTQISDPGEHEISVQALDADGTVVDVSDSVALSVGDAAADGALTLNLPATDAPLSGGRVTLNGTGTPGDEIEVLVDGQAVGRTRVRPDGTWSLTTRLDDPGDYEVSAQVLDAEDNVIASAEAQTLSIADAGALTLNSPSASDGVSGEEITFSGEGEPGTEVQLVVDGEVVGTTTVGDDGKWSLSTTIDEPGEHDIRAQALDADGNVAVSSDGLALSVVEPGAFTANLPANGLPLSAGAATFTGRGEPGSEVQVVVDGEPIGTATVGEDGTWSLDANLDEPGSYEVVVDQLDGDGNVVSSSDPTTLDVADTKLTVDAPDADALASGEGVTLSGTGEPGSQVQVVADGEVIGTATVDEDGNWSLPNALIDGNTGQIRAQAVDENGRILASSNNAPFAGDTAVTAGEEDGEEEESAGALTVNLPSADAPLSPGEAIFSGEGTPGSTVEVLVDGEVVGTTTVGPDGKWSWTGELQEPGEYEVTVQEVDDSGEMLAATEPSTLTIAEGTPLTVQVPDGGVPFSGEDVTLSGTGEPGSEVEVLVDGEVVGTATVDEDGNWSLPIAISDAGEHDVRVQTVDANGAVLASSNPVALAIAEPGQLTMQVPNNGSLSAGDVTLNGTAEPGAEVQIVVDGEVVGTTTAGDDGKWSITTPIAEAGQYQVSAQVVDAGGEVVDSLDAVALNIGDGAGAGDGAGDGTASANLGPLTLPDNIVANESTTLSGTGTPGAEVQVLVDGEVVGTTTVGEDGNWSIDTTFDAEGDYEVSAQLVDESGDVVAQSESTPLAVAAADGAAPTVELPASAAAGEEITLTGTGTPGSQVEIVIDGEVVGTADVADDGTWSFATILDAEGDYEVSAQSVDESGEVVAQSDSTPLTVAAGAAEVVAPTVELPASAAAGEEITLTGTGTPGSQVEIVIDGDVVGTADVADDGTWSFATTLDAEGDYEVSAQTVDESGEVVAQSESSPLAVAAGAAEVVAPTVELPASAAVGEEITLTGTGTPGSQVQIVLNGEVVGTADVADDGTWSFATQIDDAGEYDVLVQSLDGTGQAVADSDTASLSVAQAAAEAPTVTLPTNAIAGDTVTLTGTGEPGSTLQIVIDGEVVGTTEVDSDGNWSFDTVIDNAGDYEVSVQSVDGDQQVIAESEADSLSLAAADDAGDAGDADDAAAEDGQKPTKVTCTTDHIVQTDDWLRTLADTYWGDFTLYPAIVEGTNVKNAEDDSYNYIANPNFIKPGWKLCIVDADTARLLLQ